MIVNVNHTSLVNLESMDVVDAIVSTYESQSIPRVQIIVSFERGDRTYTCRKIVSQEYELTAHLFARRVIEEIMFAFLSDAKTFNLQELMWDEAYFQSVHDYMESDFDRARAEAEAEACQRP